MAVNRFDPTTGRPIFEDSDAPDIKVDPTQVGVFAASVGTRPMGTTAERLAYAYWRPGLAFMDIEEGVEYLHNGTAPVKRLFDTGWQNVQIFGSGFLPYGSSGWSGVKWRVINGIGMVNGAAINAGAWAAGSAICNVPAPCRPSFKTQGIAGVEMLPNGDIIATGAGGPGAVSFGIANIA